MTLSRRTLLTGAIGAAAALPLLAVPAHAATHTVAISGMAFAPADLAIAVGDSVTWTNEDGAPHTATSDSGAFDTGRLRRGDSATVTFSAAGTFAYFCAVHPSMKGTITVA